VYGKREKPEIIFFFSGPPVNWLRPVTPWDALRSRPTSQWPPLHAVPVTPSGWPHVSVSSHTVASPLVSTPIFPQSPARCSPHTCYRESRWAVPQQVPHLIAAPSVCMSSASAQLLPTCTLATTALHRWPLQRHAPRPE
jgi:hypothetical protein